MGLTSEKIMYMEYQQRCKKWAIENPELYKEWKKQKKEKDTKYYPSKRNLITNYFKKTI
jgi:hypothetical protein